MVQKNSLEFLPVIVIGGATATGKSNLAIYIAKKFNGEIISADSMQIYKGFDIGTAKITNDEMQGVVHHLIDICDGDEIYSAGKFKDDARAKIYEILERGKLPIVVGGTGLYLNTLIFNYQFGGKGKAEKSKPEFNFLCFVAENDRKVMYEKINDRVDLMIKNGLLDEISKLLNNGYSFDSAAFRAIGYKEFKPYFSGDETIDSCVQSLKQNTRHYAKRQVTWFKQWQNFAYYVNASDMENISKIVEGFLDGKY